MTNAELYEQIEKIIRTEETPILASDELTTLINELDCPNAIRRVIFMTMIATRSLTWEAHAEILEERAGNLRRNARVLQALATF